MEIPEVSGQSFCKFRRAYHRRELLVRFSPAFEIGA